MQSSRVESHAVFATEPHLRHGGAAIWFTSPAGAIMQMLEPTRGTVEVANWLVGPAYEELDRRYLGRSGLIFVFDLALMTGRTHAARSVFLSKARECASRFAEGYFVPPLVESSASKQASEAAIAQIRALGVQVQVVDSAAYVVASRSLRPQP